MENSKIEWTDHTFNPWTGCQKVSAGCQNCYAEAMWKRFGRDFSRRERTSPQTWRKVKKWNLEAGEKGQRSLVFCGSLCDVLDESVPAAWRKDLADLIIETPNLFYLLLTKRPENYPQLCADLPLNLLDHVGIGTTVENQEMADLRIPRILKIRSKFRFLSIEPLIGPIDLDLCQEEPDPDGCYEDRRHGIHWVIAGGESGRNARPMDLDWVRSLRDQCQAANVPFMVKQLHIDGRLVKDVSEFPEDLQLQEFPDDTRA